MNAEVIQLRPDAAPIISLSEITTLDGSPVTKRFWLGEDGELHSKVAAQICQAKARKIGVTSLQDYAEMRDSIAADQERDVAFTPGITDHDELLIVTKKMQPDYPDCGTRTRNYFHFPQLKPGDWLGDYDPADDETPLTPDELVATLRAANPWLKCDLLVNHSTSSCIYEKATGRQLRGQRGLHVEAFISDAGKTAMVTEAAFQGLAAAGHLRALITKAGTILPRTYVDRSVAQPERLVFVGYADVSDELEQRKPKGVIYPGECRILDVNTVPQPAAYDDWKKTSLEWKRVRQAAEPEAAKVREAWLKARLAEGKIKRATLIRALDKGVLGPDWLIYLDDGEVVTIAKILEEPHRYHDRRCGDPLDPTYREGYSDAVIYSADKKPVIYSFNGGVNFWLDKRDEGAPSEAIPLYVDPGEPKSFPMHALGSLEAPARALARLVQCPDAMAANCVLAVASMGAQAHANVKLPYGDVQPLSLFLLTVGDSGERKSAAKKLVMKDVRALQRELLRGHEEALREFRNGADVYEKAKQVALSGKKGFDRDKAKEELDKLEAPQAPLTPMLECSEPTIEGLVKMLATNIPCVGLFNDEAGSFLGGYSMRDETKLAAASRLSQIWDGRPLDSVRVKDGIITLYDRRVAVHFMAQRGVAANFLGDALLRDQGLLNRFLVCAPVSTMGGRFYKEPDPADGAVVDLFSRKVAALLRDCAKAIEVDLNVAKRRDILDSMGVEAEVEDLTTMNVLSFTQDARDVWVAFHDEIEIQLAAEKRFAELTGFAAKLAENGRIAGVLTVIERGKDADGIDARSMRRATDLARFYADEALRLFGHAAVDPVLIDAEKLHAKLERKFPDQKLFSMRDAMRAYAMKTTTKARTGRLLEILRGHGYVEEVEDRWRLTDSKMLHLSRIED